MPALDVLVRVSLVRKPSGSIRPRSGNSRPGNSSDRSR
jgi:hypothetical protein